MQFKSNKKHFLILGIALFIAVIVYKTGTHIPAPSNEEKKLAQQYETLFQAQSEGKNIDVYAPKENIPLIEDIQGKTYQAAYPSIGPLLTTIPVEIIFKSNKASLNASYKNIKEDQKIILYTPDDELLGLGTITKVSTTEVEYTFDDEYIAALNKESFNNLADILISETGPLKRILHSSIIKEDSGYYVYLAKSKRDENGKIIIEPEEKTIVAKITKQPINTDLYDNWYVEAGYDVHTTDLILLNPDNNLKENSTIKIQIMKLRASTSGPSVQAWLNKVERKNLQLSEDWKIRVASCNLAAAVRAASQNDDKSKSSSSCGGKSSGSGGCGTTDSSTSSTVDAYKLLGIERLTTEQTLKSSAPIKP